MIKDIDGKSPNKVKTSQPSLPQTTESLCPECRAVIPATLYAEDQQVWMRKVCDRDGEYRELISTDVDFYLKFERLGQEEWVAQSPAERSQPGGQAKGCPNDCGLCGAHRSSTMMAVIDITNRCNLRCPVCFANSAVQGRVCEPTLAEIKFMMDRALAGSGVRAPCLQLSGGEPTLHPDFLPALREARRRGFAQVQIASNGVRFAQDAGLAQSASEAGLNVVYLQFDGVDDAVYLQTRGRELREIKDRAVENLHRAGVEVVLVPTLVKGVNDHQIGDIFRYAVAHSDVIVGISWQPVSFVGRIDQAKRLAMRFTLSDLAREMEAQTGGAVQMHRDWYPLSFVSPFSRLIQAITGQDQPAITCHQRCGAATYVVVDPVSGNYRSLPVLVDVEGLIGRMKQLAAVLETRRWFRQYTLMRALKGIDDYVRHDPDLAGWGSAQLVDFMTGFAEFRNRYPNNEARIKELRGQRYRSLLLVAMHFQDVYNFEIPRARRCVVHYTALDGRQYPFCTYNGGPCFRERVEGRYDRTAKAPEGSREETLVLKGQD